MTQKVNGTDAKTIALHFLDATTDGRNTPHVIAKTINQAKSLLRTGYTVEEVCATIDYVVNSGTHMYSIGYLNACIADILPKLEAERLKIQAEEQKRLLAEKEKEAQGEVNMDVESTERNRRKAERIRAESRKRTEHYFDLFEGN